MLNVVGLNYKKYLKINKIYFRPAEVELLIADYSKINKKIGWKPRQELKIIEKWLLMI